MKHRFLIYGAVGAFLLPAAAAGNDEQLLGALANLYPAATEADHSAAGGRGGADAVQAQYNAARDLQEALADAEPVSASCRPLLRAVRQFASAQLLQVEGFDRPWPPLTTRGMLEAARASADVDRRRPSCVPAAVAHTNGLPTLTTPLSGEAFFGEIRDKAPPGARRARLTIGRRPPIVVSVTDRRLRFRISPSVPSRKYDIAVAYLPAVGTTVVGRAEARNVWLLPPSAQKAVRERVQDETLAGQLARLARAFSGYSGIWVHDLASGRTAGWNSDARFAAASTVKLAIYIAALGRYGPDPEKSHVAYDLKALAGWSSNAAANRLLLEVGDSESGGSAVAQQVLDRLGATSSTYTGNYRLGTAFKKAVDVTNPPPIISSRVTTAHDLARILFLIHAGARGERSPLRTLRLTRHEARVALGLLLSWQAPAPGDNLGLFRPALGPSIPIAQKNGWFSSVRHTAAIIYTATGPKIVVVLTYRPGITLGEAQAVGGRVLAAAGVR